MKWLVALCFIVSIVAPILSVFHQNDSDLSQADKPAWRNNDFSLVSTAILFMPWCCPADVAAVRI
jgi:hypothetical protein